MPRPKLFVASLLLASSVAVPACKPDRGDKSDNPVAGNKVVEREPPRPRGMPRPLALPAKPQFAAHVANPGQALAAIGQLTGQGSEPRAVLQFLMRETPTSFGAAFFEDVDLERPWSAAIVEGQLVIRVAIRKSAVPDTKRMLATKPAVGDFGAVELRKASENESIDPPPPRLAWLDAENATLTLAGDERGLATGRELGKAYGKDGLFFTLDGAEIRKAIPEFPFDRIGLEGKSVADFHVTADGGDGKIEGIDEITEGALTGLLASPELAAGASSKYAKYQSVVKTMISEASRTVEKQNFLVRGVLEDMLKRYKAVLRSWNGRVMLGVGPKEHVLAAFGSDDPRKAAASAVSLIESVMDNLDLARTFGVSVPKLRFKRNRATAAGVTIHVLALENARKMMPPELGVLFDSEGDLRIAFAGSPNAGAVMVAVGPTATESLARWIESTKNASPGHKTTDHLLAAAFAVDAGSIPGLATGNPSLVSLLGLSPERAPTTVTATRKDATYDIYVTGPLPKVTERRAPARRPPADPRMRPGVPGAGAPARPR